MTNDGATILSLLDIEHPAGKILVDLAQQQDKEVGFHRWFSWIHKSNWMARSGMELRLLFLSLPNFYDARTS